MNKLKNYIKRNKLKRRGALLVGATGLSNFLNLLYSAYLGRTISLEDFAIISFLGSILSFSDIFIGALGATITHKSAYVLGRYSKTASTFWKNLRQHTFLVSLAIFASWILLSPFIAEFFKVNSILPILIFSPVWIFSLLTSVDGGYLSGNMKFEYLAISSILEALVKLAVAFLFVSTGNAHYTYIALTVSMFVSFALTVTGAKLVEKKAEKLKRKVKDEFPVKFYLSNVLSKISTIAYLSFDVILAKHFLSPSQAGQYALLALSGRMVFLAGSFFAQFVLPLVSHHEGMGKNSSQVFYKLLMLTFASSFGAYVLIGFFGNITMPFLFGGHARPIVDSVNLYALSMVAFTIATTIVSFHQIQNKHLLPMISFVFALLQILLVSLFHNSAKEVASIMTFLGFASFFVTASVHFLSSKIITAFHNLIDFVYLFRPIKPAGKVTGLRILVFNWRDTKHKWAGGAETYIHELAKKWVEEGNEVTIFCGNDEVNPKDQIIEGVNVIRRGGFYTVYFWAAFYYIFKLGKNTDIIVDSENGLPFFTPLFSMKPVILLIHHVHQEVFMSELKFPFSYIAKFMEGKLMPGIYRNSTVITVSESSKNAIINLKLAKEENIQIVSPGIVRPTKLYKKEKQPTFIYLGRLKPYKNIDVAIKAFSLVNKKIEKSKLLIVGDGESREKLQALAERLNLKGKVKFFGKVSERKKIKLLSESWIALQPSKFEGWGITVLEANACKTPVIASDTIGLRDSILNEKTGVLVAIKDTKAFAKTMLRLTLYRKKREEMSRNAYTWSNNFSWEKASENFYSVLESDVNRKRYIFTRRQVSYLLSRFTSLF